MVLYKRKPVQPLRNPVIDDSSREIWQISQTGEVFISYRDYIERLDFYKTKQFSCEITGHMNLNFFEALSSEQKYSQDVEQAFPEPLKEPVLRKVQFSTVSRIDTLVDQLHESFKSDFYPGEHVTAILPNGDRVEAVIREKTMFPELRFANGDIQRKGFSRYTVRMVNRGDEEAQIDNEHLIRDKKTFTKAMFRSFVKNTVSREPWNGAPWLVKDEYATRYKIPTTVPQHLQRATAAERKAQQARRKHGSSVSVDSLTNGQSSPPPLAPPVEIRPAPKSHKSKTQQAMKMSKLLSGPGDDTDGPSVSGTPWGGSPSGTPDSSMNKFNGKGFKKAESSPAPNPAPAPKPIKYPIEDLEVTIREEGFCRPQLHKLSDLSVVPDNGSNEKIRSEHADSVQKNGIDEEITQFYLSTWVYLNIYCEPLVLDSFTFDDYLQALQFNNQEVECELLVEIHCALLKIIVNEQGIVQPQLPEIEEDDDESEAEDDHSNQNGVDDSENMADAEANHNSSDAGSRKSVSKERRHRADKLYEDGDSWVQRAKVRDFKNGGWQSIVVGILHQLSADSRFAKDTDQILELLVPPEEEATFEMVKNRYTVLDCNLRVMILHLLSRLTHETRAVRDYMEECAEEMTKHRKEKIEHQRARKVFLEELKSLEDDRKILLPENTPKSPSPETQPNSSDDDGDIKMNGVDDEDEDDEDGDPIRGLRRGGDRALERKRKRVEEKSKADAAAKIPKTSKQFQKVLKSIETVQNKITKEEEDINNLDEDLRQADCARFRMLGRDRFYNTYWWFERNGMPFGGLPSSSTAFSGYANAMVWVQGPHDDERQGFLVEECGSTLVDTDGDVSMNGHGGKEPFLKRQEREESGTTLTSAIQYGFIESPEELGQLLSWLDVRGIREKKLKASIETYKSHIVEGMTNRVKYLAGELVPEEGAANMGGRTTRGKTYFDPSVWRCLQWRNDSMLEEHGHTHYDHPQPRKNAKKKKEPKDVPRNRAGKPLSRQGDTYNF